MVYQRVDPVFSFQFEPAVFTDAKFDVCDGPTGRTIRADADGGTRINFRRSGPNFRVWNVVPYSHHN